MVSASPGATPWPAACGCSSATRCAPRRSRCPWCWCTAWACWAATCCRPQSTWHRTSRSTCPTCPASATARSRNLRWTCLALAEALAAWIMAAGLGRVAPLGNSFGCQIIADLAACHPELVGRAVLQGPTTPPDERPWRWQFVRWRQNQPYNPDLLSPITGGDYRKCGYRCLLQTFRYQLQDPIEHKLRAPRRRSWWCAGSSTRSADHAGRRRWQGFCR